MSRLRTGQASFEDARTIRRADPRAPGGCGFLQPQAADDLLRDRLGGELFFKMPVPHEPYEGFVPDIMMTNGDTTNLLDLGVDGIVRHTTGHTPGSIAVELASEDALVGDLLHRAS